MLTPNLVDWIVEEAAAKRRETGSTVLGAEAVLRQDPHHRPASVVKSPKPMFHTATVDAYRTLYKAFSEIFAMYRIASERLRAGFFDADFPEGTFPCALPFVRACGPAPARAAP